MNTHPLGRLLGGSGDTASQRGLTIGADAGEEGLGGLVGGVLRDELAAEGTLEDRCAVRAYCFCGALFDDCFGVIFAPCDFGTTTGPFAFDPL
jgi:hypothetical protein